MTEPRTAPCLQVSFEYLRNAQGVLDTDEMEQVVAVFETGSFVNAAKRTNRNRETIAASWRRFRTQARIALAQIK